MSYEDPAYRPAVGRQLAKRRRQLDFTQLKLAAEIGLTSQTISAIERGVNSIQLNRRSTWEETLKLVAGTITRAYTYATPLELLPIPTAEEYDKLIAVLTARIERLEESLDVERQAREALARDVAELRGGPAGDPADGG